MNNDEFIKKNSDKLSNNKKDAAAEIVASISDIIAEGLQNGKIISLEGFGEFEVKKEKEHVIVNPSTKQRILVPPTLAVYFKPDDEFANKMNII